MEFIVTQEKFHRALQTVQGIVDRRTTMPILSNVLLDCADGQLKMMATDLEVSLQISIPVNSRIDGKTTVLAKKLFEIIRELPEDDLTISSDENDTMHISCRNISFRLNGLSPEEFPSFPEFDESDLREIEASKLAEMIEKTIYAAASEDIQFNLSGIFIEKLETAGNVVRFVATDGHRLSLIDRELNLPFIEDEGIIVPRKGIFEIRKLLHDGDTPKITVNKSQLIMLFDDTILYVRLIDGTFPNYREVIPPENPKKIALQRSTFLECLKRATIVSIDKSKSCKFELSDNCLTISASNPDVGESEEEIPIDYGEERMVIAFNSKYFIDVLNCLAAEEITLELDNESSPAIIKEAGDENFLAVIMPMRL